MSSSLSLRGMFYRPELPLNALAQGTPCAAIPIMMRRQRDLCRTWPWHRGWLPAALILLLASFSGCGAVRWLASRFNPVYERHGCRRHQVRALPRQRWDRH